jgi:molybdenum cofactor cytidylyltransferase
MIAALVLAAGRSIRFGLPKALLPAGPGETLLSRAVGVAAASVDGPVVPVIGSDAALALVEIQRLHEPRLLPTVNPRFAEGLSTSLQAGLGAVATAEGVLILLADQPGVEAARASELVARFRSREASIEAVVAAEGGEQRTPVVLGRKLFAAVADLRGDEGARRILRSEPDHVLRIEWGRGPWAVDVDTWEGYASFARDRGWQLEGTQVASPGPVGRRTDVEQAWNIVLESSEPLPEKLAALRRLALAAL